VNINLNSLVAKVLDGTLIGVGVIIAVVATRKLLPGVI
jgi:hypothetical protein